MLGWIVAGFAFYMLAEKYRIDSELVDKDLKKVARQYTAKDHERIPPVVDPTPDQIWEFNNYWIKGPTWKDRFGGSEEVTTKEYYDRGFRFSNANF